jgi:hypothetical protein
VEEAQAKLPAEEGATIEGEPPLLVIDTPVNNKLFKIGAVIVHAVGLGS